MLIQQIAKRESFFFCLAKPKAIVIIPQFQPLPNHLRKKTGKSANYRLQLRSKKTKTP